METQPNRSTANHVRPIILPVNVPQHRVPFVPLRAGQHCRTSRATVGIFRFISRIVCLLSTCLSYGDELEAEAFFKRE